MMIAFRMVRPDVRGTACLAAKACISALVYRGTCTAPSMAATEAYSPTRRFSSSSMVLEPRTVFRGDRRHVARRQQAVGLHTLRIGDEELDRLQRLRFPRAVAVEVVEEAAGQQGARRLHARVGRVVVDPLGDEQEFREAQVDAEMIVIVAVGRHRFASLRWKSPGNVSYRPNPDTSATRCEAMQARAVGRGWNDVDDRAP